MTADRDAREFLRRFHADEEAGTLQTRADYCSMFPGAESAIARGFEQLRREPEDDSAGPTRVGPYDLFERLGRGGQGQVFRAIDARVGREVAIKFLTRFGSVLDPTTAVRFRREAEIASRLDHPSICPVFDVDVDGDPPYLVMPLLRGETLAQRLHRVSAIESIVTLSPPDATDETSGSGVRRTPAGRAIDRVLWLGERLGRGLHAAHEAGILHRDVKPANIFLRDDGEPVLLDFGLAQDVASDTPRLTATGQIVGTLPYMAPEQILGQRAQIDRRADVYALGVVIYECLTRHRPFRAGTDRALRDAILRREADDPRTFHPEIPRDLCVILAKALEKDPERRYATAAAFADELRRVRESRPILARPAGTWTRTTRWTRRNPTLATAVALLVVGLAVSLWLLRGRMLAVDQRDEAAKWREIALAELRLAALPQRVETLWPAVRGVVTMPDGMDHWLAQARELVDDLPEYQRLRDEIERGGTQLDEPDDPRSRRERDQLRHELEETRQALEHAQQSEDRVFKTWLPTLERRIAGYEARLAQRPLRFDDPETARRAASLRVLTAEIPTLGPVIEKIERRREFALTVRSRTVDEQRAAWQRAADAVAADQRFGDFALRPRVGLVPLGADPTSGLQEFAHLLTGAAAERGADGTRIEEDTGIVFVLLPGGTFRMGAHIPDAAHPAGGANADGMAHVAEGPIHAVSLAPFYLAKHTMTQGQWLRITGSNPSQNAATSTSGGHRIDLRHPVESITWHDAVRVLGRVGLVLPTEAQWEFAARAGTTTPWWTGPDKESIAGAGNIADAYAHSQSARSGWRCEMWLDDGHYVHAPVGIYAPNPFGLHDVIGNVFEWCRDGFSRYSATVRAGDGLRSRTFITSRAARGAGYSSQAQSHRSSARARFSPEMKVYYLGVRPAIYPANAEG